MKKQLFFIAIFIGLPFFSMAQEEYHPFPTKNCVWTEYFHPAYGSGIYHNFALKDNDTIIKGKSYHKLYHSYDTIFTEDKLCGGLREENKRVYFYSIDSVTCLNAPIPIDTEIILYDFNLKFGDTITEDTYRIRHLNMLDIEKIDSIMVGTEFRKRYYFGWYGGIISYEQWIEGIGCYRGLLSDIGDWPINDWNIWLVCFIPNREVLYHSTQFPNCYNKNPNVVQLIENKSKIKIAPNPAGSTLKIELNKTDYQKLILTNQTGRELRQYQLEGIQTLSIERDKLPDGIYFFSVYDKKGEIQTLKILLK
jgi:hypothetical protein